MDYLEIKELYHHGIKGQTWGVKNGPPYPLGASDKSRKEIGLSGRLIDRSSKVRNRVVNKVEKNVRKGYKKLFKNSSRVVGLEAHFIKNASSNVIDKGKKTFLLMKSTTSNLFNKVSSSPIVTKGYEFTQKIFSKNEEMK